MIAAKTRVALYESLQRCRPAVVRFGSINQQQRFQHYSTFVSLPSELESAIEHRATLCRDRLARLKADHGDTVIENVTVRTALSGMRNVKLLLCDTSEVDPVEGISYRGIPIQAVLNTLPREGNSPPHTEGLLWLLLTGEFPNASQVAVLREEIIRRMDSYPHHATAVIDALPVETHPMTQFIIGIAACQTESHFSKHYKEGSLRKGDYWRPILDDGLSLMAKVPRIASHIYYRSFKNLSSKSVPTFDPSLDWAANVAHLMGFEDPKMRDVFRLYMFLHADHEGGNVSAHTAHLVGSALSDPFLSFAASMAGLAGPLHGLANQESLKFLRHMRDEFASKHQSINAQNVEQYIDREFLKKGRVVPGFGHAVLRAIDPRFVIQRQFAHEHISNNDLNDLLSVCCEVIPKVLAATGKVSNPHPNVDAHSGVILSHFGMKEESFYTVPFGLSRLIGIISQLVWDRIFNLPIERPKSTTLDHLEKLAASHASSAAATK